VAPSVTASGTGKETDCPETGEALGQIDARGVERQLGLQHEEKAENMLRRAGKDVRDVVDAPVPQFGRALAPFLSRSGIRNEYAGRFSRNLRMNPFGGSFGRLRT
jgi:hypothetical protein